MNILTADFNFVFTVLPDVQAPFSKVGNSFLIKGFYSKRLSVSLNPETKNVWIHFCRLLSLWSKPLHGVKHGAH